MRQRTRWVKAHWCILIIESHRKHAYLHSYELYMQCRLDTVLSRSIYSTWNTISNRYRSNSIVKTTTTTNSPIIAHSPKIAKFDVEHDCKPISIDFDRSNVANNWCNQWWTFFASHWPNLVILRQAVPVLFDQVVFYKMAAYCRPEVAGGVISGLRAFGVEVVPLTKFGDTSSNRLVTIQNAASDRRSRRWTNNRRSNSMTAYYV